MGLNDLIELQNWFKNQTPSSPAWFQAVDHVVGCLLQQEIEKAERRTDGEQVEVEK